MISGFTIVRNGERLGYPYKEAIASIAPLCEEIVVAVGDSSDGTREKLETLNQELENKLVLVDTKWDDSNTRGGSELSRQSNIALDHCKNDLCFYIQGDEALDDSDLAGLSSEIEDFKNDPELEGLAFHWRHFYGNFSTWVHSYKWYRRELRLLKKSAGLRSYSDAQGFRIPQGSHWRKPNVALSKSFIHHYGWVRPPETMALKSEALDRFWHGNKRDGTHDKEKVYPPHIGMRRFNAKHPKVMSKRVSLLGDFDPFSGSPLRKQGNPIRHFLNTVLEAVFDYRIGEFKNYKIVKKY